MVVSHYGPRSLRIVLNMFLSGLLLQKVYEYIIFGAKAFWADRWNFVDCGVVVVYFGSMLIRFIVNNLEVVRMCVSLLSLSVSV